MMNRPLIVLSAATLACVAVSVASADDEIDFATQVQPIFMQHCAGCHGADKAQAKLRLNTAEGVREKWDADAHLIVAGDPDKSELYQRLVLPADSPKRMPKNADPLPKDAIELIANWIRQGAVLPAAAAVAAPPAADAAADAPDESEKPAAAEPSLPEVAPASPEALQKLAAAGAQVVPLFAGSSLLQVSFAHREQPVTDADLAPLADLAEQVYVLDLKGAKITAAGLAALAPLKNLSALHLELTPTTDEGLAHLAGLSQLQYLNLYGTEVGDAGLKHLEGLKHLNRLYLWQTKVSYEAAMALEAATPGLMVNLGYNHPTVAKMRLTKELELVKKQSEEAKAEQAKAQQQLDAANKNAEAVNARLAEVEKEIKALEPPAEQKPEQPAEKAAENAAETPPEPAAAPAEEKK